MSRESKQEPAPSADPINIIWIGPPASRETGVVCAHDEWGTTQVAKHNTVKFWVLNQYADAYREKFADHPAIKIRSIESIVSTVAKSGSNADIAAYANWIQCQMKRLLSKERNHVRDRVTVKNMVAFLLLYHLGGYVLDSNVCPMNSDKPIQFKAYDKFMFPKYKERIYGGSDMDVWMLYSPRHFNRALRSCLRFQSLTDQAETTHQREGYSARYHTLCGSNVVSAALDRATVYSLPNLTDTDGWAAKCDHTTGIAKVPELLCEKYYFNTHKHQAHQNQAFFLIQANRPIELQRLLKSGDDINQTVSSPPWRNYSLLHAAILWKSTEALSVILHHNPDMTLRANYGPHTYTALQLCKSMEQSNPGQFTLLLRQLTDHSSKRALIDRRAAGIRIAERKIEGEHKTSELAAEPTADDVKAPSERDITRTKSAAEEKASDATEDPASTDEGKAAASDAPATIGAKCT